MKTGIILYKQQIYIIVPSIFFLFDKVHMDLQ